MRRRLPEVSTATPRRLPEGLHRSPLRLPDVARGGPDAYPAFPDSPPVTSRRLPDVYPMSPRCPRRRRPEGFKPARRCLPGGCNIPDFIESHPKFSRRLPGLSQIPLVASYIAREIRGSLPIHIEQGRERKY